MDNERALLELSIRLKEELVLYIEGVSPLYPGSEERVREMAERIRGLVGKLKAEGGERLLATARYLEDQLGRINQVVEEYLKSKAKEN